MPASKPASPSTARAINDRLALRLLQQEGPLTAGQLKQLTGLSRPTVADLVDRLTASGLIEVVGETGEQRRGPNAKLHGIVAGRAHLAALDVRTEGVSVLVSDLVGRVLTEASVPIGGDLGTGPAVEQAVTLVERAVKEARADRLHTVGIGAPGLIDPATGELRDSTGLPEWHRRLVAALQERLPDARVTVENETNLAALAEQREGAATDRDTFVLLWLGHGTGAAVVLDGTLRRGASGGTGEIGFLPVPGTEGLPSAKACAGGFHSLAGSAAVLALAAEHALTGPQTSDGPGAASVVRAAVTALRGEAMGSGEGGSAGVGGRPGGVGSSVVGGRAVGEGLSGGGTSAGGGRAVGVDSSGVELSAVGGRAVDVSGVEPSAAGGSAVGVDVSGVGSSAVGGSAVGVGPSGVGASAVESSAERVGSSSASFPADTGAVPAGVAPLGAASAGAAARFLDVLADRVALGVASVVAVLDPGCVVLGGEVGQAGGAELAARVEARIRRMAPLATEVRSSVLGGTAVLRGALLTARESAQEELFAPRDR
ncbi:ROK family protein [Streptomyces sp. NPDC018693]|uniref:ROK family protein n=1 Tax=unclassified Streptomyces TaxID=2593676 RepID=UPI00378B2795